MLHQLNIISKYFNGVSPVAYVEGVNKKYSELIYPNETFFFRGYTPMPSDGCFISMRDGKEKAYIPQDYEKGIYNRLLERWKPILKVYDSGRYAEFEDHLVTSLFVNYINSNECFYGGNSSVLENTDRKILSGIELSEKATTTDGRVLYSEYVEMPSKMGIYISKTMLKNLPEGQLCSIQAFKINETGPQYNVICADSWQLFFHANKSFPKVSVAIPNHFDLSLVLEKDFLKKWKKSLASADLINFQFIPKQPFKMQYLQVKVSKEGNTSWKITEEEGHEVFWHSKKRGSIFLQLDADFLKIILDSSLPGDSINVLGGNNPVTVTRPGVDRTLLIMPVIPTDETKWVKKD